MKFPNKSLSSIKTNSSTICFTFYCQYWLILYTYTVYENYHDAFPSFFSHGTILIKHEIKEPFRKNYFVMSLYFARNTFVHIMRVCDSILKNAWEMTFLFMLNCHVTVTFVMTQKLTLSIRQSRYTEDLYLDAQHLIQKANSYMQFSSSSVSILLVEYFML